MKIRTTYRTQNNAKSITPAFVRNIGMNYQSNL